MDMNLHTDHTAIADHRDHAETFSRADAEVHSIAPRRAASLVAAPCGSGWYHDSAIAQAQQASVEARCNPYR